MKQGKMRKGVVVTACIAAALIMVGVFVMYTVLSNAASAQEEALHTEAAPKNVIPGIVGTGDETGLTIKTVNGWGQPPADAVTYQYAIAAASDEAERLFGSPITEKTVFVELLPLQGTYAGKVSDDRVWMVLANIDGGDISAQISLDGTIVSLSKSTWSLLISQEETLREMQEQKERYEREGGVITYNDGGGWGVEFPEDSVPTIPHPDLSFAYDEEGQIQQDEWSSPENQARIQKEIDDRLEQSRQKMRDTAAATEGEPQNALAVEMVNRFDLGKGATAVSAKTMSMWPETETYRQDGSPGPVQATVQVSLDNGKYVFVYLQDKSTMDLEGYMYCDVDLITNPYG